MHWELASHYFELVDAYLACQNLEKALKNARKALKVSETCYGTGSGHYAFGLSTMTDRPAAGLASEGSLEPVAENSAPPSPGPKKPLMPARRTAEGD